jgi:SNF-related kinase
LTLNEIYEEGMDDSKKSPTANTVVAVVPRVVVTRQKFHKNRTASCSSSDASDEDSESRKKRAHKLKTLPGNSRRRDSHDDSSDSQGGQGGSGNGGGESGSPENTTVTDNSEKQQQSSSSSNGGNNNGRRHTGFRRRCGTAGETRLRESQSLNRITEVQESSESLTQTLTNSTITQATSPRSRRSFGARFLLLVGGGGSGHSKKSQHENNVETKENCTTTSKTKITRYFHLHRKLCLPIFKQNHNTNNNNNNPSSTNDVWLGASKPV